LDDGPTEWCAMPLGYKRYLLSRGVGTREPRKYSEITHPGSGNLTEKGHARYSVMTSVLTTREGRCSRRTCHRGSTAWSRARRLAEAGHRRTGGGPWWCAATAALAHGRGDARLRGAPSREPAGRRAGAGVRLERNLREAVRGAAGVRELAEGRHDSEWAYKNGYLECDDDMQGILASVDNGVYTCDALVLLMECETDLSAGLIPSLPQNTTGAPQTPASARSPATPASCRASSSTTSRSCTRRRCARCARKEATRRSRG
jgi:hypothetical protein